MERLRNVSETRKNAPEYPWTPWSIPGTSLGPPRNHWDIPWTPGTPLKPAWIPLKLYGTPLKPLKTAGTLLKSPDTRWNTPGFWNASDTPEISWNTPATVMEFSLKPLEHPWYALDTFCSFIKRVETPWDPLGHPWNVPETHRNPLKRSWTPWITLDSPPKSPETSWIISATVMEWCWNPLEHSRYAPPRYPQAPWNAPETQWDPLKHSGNAAS